MTDATHLIDEDEPEWHGPAQNCYWASNPEPKALTWQPQSTKSGSSMRPARSLEKEQEYVAHFSARASCAPRGKQSKCS